MIHQPESALRNKSKSTHLCEECNAKGYLLQPGGSHYYKSHIDLSICQCIESKCVCDKKPPYMYYDKKNFQLKSCECRRVRKILDTIRFRYKGSNIPAKYLFHRIHEFDTNHNDVDCSQTLTMALDNAYLFLEEWEQRVLEANRSFVKGWYIFGPPGSGKTFLSCLMLNECLLRYQTNVRYVKITRDFLNQIRSSYNLESKYYGKGDDLIEKISHVDILLLDDFGVQKDSEWEKRMLYDLIDTRYEYAKTTIVTSNIPPKELQPLFGGRIYSRIKEMMRIQDIISTDYRDRFQQ